MQNSTKSELKSAREISYYRQRFKNRVFSRLLAFVGKTADDDGLTQKDVAKIIGKDAGQLSRLLREPSNLTLDTISDLLLAFDAEAEPMKIVRFKDRRAPNYMHPLVSRTLKIDSGPRMLGATKTPNRPAILINGGPNISIVTSTSKSPNT
jgi:transcriptional regulator with XRE-family HTH domain